MYLTLKILHILLEPTKKETYLDVDSKNLLSKIVKDYDVDVNSDFKHILSNMNDSGGFEGRNLANGIAILQNMMNEKNCTKFLSFVGFFNFNWK